MRRPVRAALVILLAATVVPATPAAAAPSPAADEIEVLAGQAQPVADPARTAMQPFGLAVQTAGAECISAESPGQFPSCDTIFVADPVNYVVRSIREGDGGVGAAVLAGNGGKGTEGDGGDARAAQLSGPYGVAVDASSGDVYIADTFADEVRVVSAVDGSIRRLAPSVQLDQPYGIARVGASQASGPGTTYVADTLNDRVLAISDGGAVTPVGTGLLRRPRGLAVDTSGHVLIADTGNNVVRSFDPVKKTMTTLIGPSAGLQEPSAVDVAWSGPAAGTVYVADTDNGRIIGFGGGVVRTAASGFSSPFAVAALSSGDLAVGDTGSSLLKLVQPGKPSPFVTFGNGTPSHGTDADQLSGATGVGLSSGVAGLCDQAAGTTDLLVLDTFNHSLRALCTAGGTRMVDVLGNGLPGKPLRYPMGLAVASPVVDYVADTFDDVVLKVDLSGGRPVVTPVAGQSGRAGFAGDGGPATAAKLDHPGGVAVDTAGDVFIADTYNDRIREVRGGIITTIAGTGVSGATGDGGPATRARLFFPFGVAVDGRGDVFIADTFSQRIREVNGAGTISTLAGNGTAGFLDGPAAAAQFDRPWGIGVDAAGTAYVADELNHRIRYIAGGAVFSGASGTRGLGVNPGPFGTTAEVDAPRGLTPLDTDGTLLIADSFNDRARQVGSVQFQPAALDFGDVRTGLTKTLVDTFSNDGHVATRLTATTASPFTAQSCGAVVPGGTCSVPVTFAPTTPGAAPGTLTVTDTAGAARTGSLSGNGLQPALTVTDNVSTRPQVTAEQFGAGRQVVVLTLTNTGNTTLTGTMTAPSGGVFSVLPAAVEGGSATTCPSLTSLRLAPQGSCNVEVDYNCATTPDALTLVTDDAPVPAKVTHRIALTVDPTNPVACGQIAFAGTPSFNFGGVRTGDASQIPATVTNAGGRAVNLASIGTTGSAEFSALQGPNSCFLGEFLAPGATCSAVIEFAPTAADAQTGTLGIADSNSSTISAPLTGTGLQPVLQVTDAQGNPLPNPLVFGGSGSVFTSTVVSLVNTGTATLHVTVLGPSGTAFGVDVPAVTGACTQPKLTLGPGQSCLIGITYDCVVTTDQIALQTDEAPLGETVNRSIPVKGTQCPIQ
jgi:trimeric autotransporter adhesin